MGTGRRRSPRSISVGAWGVLPAFLWHTLLPLPLLAGDRTLALLPLPASRGGSSAIALWEPSARGVHGDPAFIVLDPESTAKLLAGWAEEGRRSRAERSDLALSLRGEVDRARQEAWRAYYRMDFPGAEALAERAGSAMGGLEDGALAAGWRAEMSLLAGMARQALKGGSGEAFLAAARLCPGEVLSPARFSPEVITAFETARAKAREGPRSALRVEGGPRGSEASLDGRRLGLLPLLANDLLPGPHFLAVEAEGYAPLRRVVELAPWETSSLACPLEPAGPPSDDVAGFLSRRARAGDPGPLKEAARRLGTGHLVWCDPGEEGKAGTAGLWRCDASGEARSAPLAGMDDLASLVADLRAPAPAGGAEAVALPALAPEPPPPGKRGGISWWWLLGGAVLLGLAAGSVSGGGSAGNSVSATW